MEMTSREVGRQDGLCTPLHYVCCTLDPPCRAQTAAKHGLADHDIDDDLEALLKNDFGYSANPTGSQVLRSEQRKGRQRCTVVSVGSDVTKSFKSGDRVSGFAHGAKHEDPSSGCFAEYAKVKGDIQVKIPDHISFEEAASWPTGINTTGQGMYGPGGLGLPWPNQPAGEEFAVLIYGASTNTGLWAVQYAKRSGLRVLATCSEKNFEAVKALGTDEVFDYKDVKCGENIREASGYSLKFAFDCVSEGGSMEICAKALSSDGSGARYGALLPVEFPRKDVKTSFTIGYSVNGEEFTFFGNHVPAKPNDFEFGKQWWSLAERLLAEGEIKAPATTIREGGLQGVLEGFEDMKNRRISRQKLVYRVANTV